MVQNMEINVSFLTESEQEFILEVLRRDEELRRLEELRVKWVSRLHENKPCSRNAELNTIIHMQFMI